jgi:hypothetical protein
MEMSASQVCVNFFTSFPVKKKKKKHFIRFKLFRFKFQIFEWREFKKFTFKISLKKNE